MSDKKPKEASTEGAEEGGKKKKGKLPVIIALVAVLGGGGFFMMKGKGGEKKKPEVKIGAEVVELGEVLVNLKDGTTYARMNLGVQFMEGFDAAHLDKQKPIIRDAIIMVVSSKSAGDIASPEGKSLLKEEIAAAINHSLHILHPPEDAKAETKKDDKKDKEKDEHGESHGAAKDEHKMVPREKREHPEWDSDEGPALKIYFSDFVTT